MRSWAPPPSSYFHWPVFGGKIKQQQSEKKTIAFIYHKCYTAAWWWKKKSTWEFIYTPEKRCCCWCARMYSSRRKSSRVKYPRTRKLCRIQPKFVWSEIFCAPTSRDPAAAAVTTREKSIYIWNCRRAESMRVLHTAGSRRNWHREECKSIIRAMGAENEINVIVQGEP